MMRSILAAAPVLVVLLAGPEARAEPPLWRVDPEQTTIRFEYTVNDRAREGRFAQVEGEGRFSPGQPEETRLELRIPARGLKLDSLLETAFAQGPEWFDVANHPVARYRLARLDADGDGGWTALGDLTIKERTVITRTPLALSIEAGRAEATGALSVNRRDFGLGVGLSDVVLDIADEVTVTFTMVAVAQD